MEVETNCHLVIESMLLSQGFFCRRNAGMGAHWGCCESLFSQLGPELTLVSLGFYSVEGVPNLGTDFIKMLNFSNFSIG